MLCLAEIQESGDSQLLIIIHVTLEIKRASITNHTAFIFRLLDQLIGNNYAYKRLTCGNIHSDSLRTIHAIITTSYFHTNFYILIMGRYSSTIDIAKKTYFGINVMLFLSACVAIYGYQRVSFLFNTCRTGIDIR